MATSIKAPTQWANQSANNQHYPSLYSWLVAFAERQSDNKTIWFLAALIFQSLVFLPLPALLIYYYNAPIVILAITLTLFVANVIVGMRGASVKTIFRLSIESFLINLAMAIICILA